jgi:hypothetical protein
MSTIWDKPGVTEDVVRRYKAGERPREIADFLGVTRNTINAKLDRMGVLNRRPSEPRRYVPKAKEAKVPPAPKPAKAKPSAPRTIAAPVASIPAVRVSETRTYAQPGPQPLPVFRPEPVASTPKPWLERRFGECAYPVSGEGAETFSCCAPVWKRTEKDGRIVWLPYCEGHWRRAHQSAATEAQKKAAIKAREAKAKQLRRAAA